MNSNSLIDRLFLDCPEVLKEGAVCAVEGTAMEDDGANGADGLVIGDADIAAMRLFLDRHFRNDGNAHTRADHAEQATELTAFENDLRMETRPVAGGNGSVAETVAVA